MAPVWHPENGFTVGPLKTNEGSTGGGRPQRSGEKMENNVRPFRTWRYSPEKTGNIGSCLTLPYDVISSDEQDGYYRLHEHNVVRLVLGKTHQSDDDTNNRYTRASAYLKDWKQKGVIVREENPALWMYQLEYKLPELGNRRLRGFIGSVDLQDFETRRVLPHERVMPAPIEDRMKLASTTRTHFESIWCFYNDEEHRAAEVFDRVCQAKPFLTTHDNTQDVTHTLWRIGNTEDQKLLQSAVSPQSIYIADGHHRYQTMLSLRKQDPTWDRLLMYLVNTKDEEMTVLPYHRLLISAVDGWDPDRIINAAMQHFHVRSLPSDNVESVMNTITREKAPAFGFLSRNRSHLLVLKDAKAYLESQEERHDPSWHLLPVNVLKDTFLKGIIGLSDDQLTDQSVVGYTHSAAGAIQQIKTGACPGAFLLRACTTEEIAGLAGKGEVMPRKSTYFYPKLLSGLVMMGMDGHGD